MKLILTILTILIFIGGFAFAKSADLPQPGLPPDHPLFVFQDVFEKMQLFFAFSPESKANIHLQFAEKRLAELNLSIHENKTDLIPILGEKYEQEVNETENEVNSTISSGKNITELAEHVAEETFKHRLVLERVLAKAPEKARGHIEHAINASSNGHENAVENILEHGNITGLVNITFTVGNQTYTQTFNVTSKENKTHIEKENEHNETCEDCENETIKINPAGKQIGPKKEHENEEETTTTTQISANTINNTNATISTNTTSTSNSTTTSISNATQTTTTTHGKSGEKKNSNSSEND